MPIAPIGAWRCEGQEENEAMAEARSMATARVRDMSAAVVPNAACCQATTDAPLPPVPSQLVQAMEAERIVDKSVHHKHHHHHGAHLSVHGGQHGTHDHSHHPTGRAGSAAAGRGDALVSSPATLAGAAGNASPHTRDEVLNTMRRPVLDLLESQSALEEFIENRYLSAERYTAFLVLFHAMAERVASFRPLSFDTSRSQSRLRVATTAAPVSAADLHNTWQEGAHLDAPTVTPQMLLRGAADAGMGGRMALSALSSFGKSTGGGVNPDGSRRGGVNPDGSVRNAGGGAQRRGGLLQALVSTGRRGNGGEDEESVVSAPLSDEDKSATYRTLASQPLPLGPVIPEEAAGGPLTAPRRTSSGGMSYSREHSGSGSRRPARISQPRQGSGRAAGAGGSSMRSGGGSAHGGVSWFSAIIEGDGVASPDGVGVQVFPPEAAEVKVPAAAAAPAGDKPQRKKSIPPSLNAGASQRSVFSDDNGRRGTDDSVTYRPWWQVPAMSSPTGAGRASFDGGASSGGGGHRSTTSGKRRVAALQQLSLHKGEEVQEEKRA